jgi:hypothetical protein
VKEINMAFVLVILFTIAIFVGLIDYARIALNRTRIDAERIRKLLDFALANFERLKDRELNLITEQSLHAAKFTFFNAEQRAHVDELGRALNTYGHVHRTIEDPAGQRYVFAISEDDLNRVRAMYQD